MPEADEFIQVIKLLNVWTSKKRINIFVNTQCGVMKFNHVKKLRSLNQGTILHCYIQYLENS
jgi:hypothetical protein